MGERLALRNLVGDPSLVIKPADKGGGIVLMDRSMYTQEALRQLQDSTFYKVLPGNPTAGFSEDLIKIFDEALEGGVISKAELAFLHVKYPVTPIFYLLPKIHKTLSNPPGRPIISGIGSLTSNLSFFVDHFLQGFVPLLRSHIKDTIHLLTKLETLCWQPHYGFLMLDVQSLYTNIPHSLGVEAVASKLSTNVGISAELRSFLVTSMQFILAHNYFLFDGIYYLQTLGTAMGTRFAPSFANLYMAEFEESYIWGGPFSANLVFYGRYIDDLIIIWDGGSELASSFVEFLNHNSFNLKFTSSFDMGEANFLDVTLFTEGDKILAKNFRKKVDVPSYLHFSSGHYHPWLHNIPRSQMGRIRRNCTLLSDFEQQAEIMTDDFISRGYPPELINEAKSYAMNLERSTILKQVAGHRITMGQADSLGGTDDTRSIGYGDLIPVPKTKDCGTINRNDTIASKGQAKDMMFICKFNKKANVIRKIICENFKILQCDHVLGRSLPTQPRVIFKKNKDLKSYLAPSLLPAIKDLPSSTSWLSSVPLGNFRCGRKICLTCKFMINRASVVVSHVSGKVFPIKQFINCDTRYLVYVLQCTCGLQYVGRTTRALKERFREHRRSILSGTLGYSVSKHFRDVHKGHVEDISVMGVEHVPPTIRGGDRFSKLCLRETQWIFNMQCLAPEGLNEMLEFNDR